MERSIPFKFQKFLVVQNSFPIIEKLRKMNHKKNTKTISTSGFSIFYSLYHISISYCMVPSTI